MPSPRRDKYAARVQFLLNSTYTCRAIRVRSRRGKQMVAASGAALHLQAQTLQKLCREADIPIDKRHSAARPQRQWQPGCSTSRHSRPDVSRHWQDGDGQARDVQRQGRRCCDHDRSAIQDPLPWRCASPPGAGGTTQPRFSGIQAVQARNAWSVCMRACKAGVPIVHRNVHNIV